MKRPTAVPFAFGNLNNHRTPRGQLGDVEALADQGIDVIAYTEAVAALWLPGYRTFQPLRRDGTPAGEGLLVSNHVRTRHPRHVLAVDGGMSRPGSPIRDRFHTSVGVFLPGIGWVRVASVHRPPRGYPAEVLASSAAALRKVTRRRYLLAGDWNHRHPQPAGILPRNAVLVAGTRIDLAYAHPAVARHVTDVWQAQDPDRRDDHPVVGLTIKERP